MLCVIGVFHQLYSPSVGDNEMKFIHALLTKMALFVIASFLFVVNPAFAAPVDYIVKTSAGKVSYQTATQYVQLIQKYSAINGLDPSLVLHTMKVESTFNKYAVSSRGCKGLMQVCPKYHRARIAGRNLFDPEVNIAIGTQILGENVKRHGSTRKALQAYEGNMRSSKYYKSVLAGLQKWETVDESIDLAQVEQSNQASPFKYAKYNGKPKTVLLGYRKKSCYVDPEGITICSMVPITLNSYLDERFEQITMHGNITTYY